MAWDELAGEVIGWGLNSRLDNMQAAILNYKLEQYDKEVARRRQIAQIYQEGLEQPTRKCYVYLLHRIVKRIILTYSKIMRLRRIEEMNLQLT